MLSVLGFAHLEITYCRRGGRLMLHLEFMITVQLFQLCTAGHRIPKATTDNKAREIGKGFLSENLLQSFALRFATDGLKYIMI